MGKSYLLFAAMVGIVYCVNAASLPVDMKPTDQKMPHPEAPPKFAAKRDKRGAFDLGYEDGHVEDHEHHHSTHDEQYSSHHEHDFEKHHQAGHHAQFGHHEKEYDPHHGHDDEHVDHHHIDHEHEHEHDFGHKEHDLHDQHEHGHEHGHEHEHEHKYGHGHHDEHDHDDHDDHDDHVDHHDHHDDDNDEVEVHAEKFNHRQTAALSKKKQTSFENVKEVKYEVQKTKFNEQSEVNLNQEDQFDGFAFDAHVGRRPTGRYTDTTGGIRKVAQ